MLRCNQGDRGVLPTFTTDSDLPLFLFLGQSYFGMNSNNGRVLAPPVANPTLMLGGNNRLFGAGAGALEHPFTEFEPAVDFRPRVQSPVTAFLYRYAERAQQLGLPETCVGHSESRSNASIEHLLPETHPSHRTSSVFANLMAAVSSYAAGARRRGQSPQVPALFFCQGTGDRAMAGADYLGRLNDLFDTLRAEISRLTGQGQATQFYIVQPPAKPSGGRWPCLQAQIDICQMRPDCIFALSGWALPQHDRTHFSGVATVILGEICVEVYLGARRGEDLSAPRITGVRRESQVITATTHGSSRLVADAGPDTPRHRVNGAPLPNYGIQLDCGNIADCKIGENAIKITLAPDSPDPKKLYFAHASRESLGLTKMASKANQSVNRGNIRSDRSFESLFLDEPFYQWLASSAHDIS